MKFTRDQLFDLQLLMLMKNPYETEKGKFYYEILKQMKDIEDSKALQKHYYTFMKKIEDEKTRSEFYEKVYLHNKNKIELGTKRLNEFMRGKNNE